MSGPKKAPNALEPPSPAAGPGPKNVPTPLARVKKSPSKIGTKPKKRSKPAPARSPSRSKHPWAKALAFFLTPNIAAPGAEPTWPTLAAVAAEFGIPFHAVRLRSADDGWLRRQVEAEDAWWKERNAAIYRQMAQRLPQAQGMAFRNASRVLSGLAGDLNGNLDVTTRTKVAKANAQALQTVIGAAGLSPAQILPVQPLVEAPVVRFTQSEEVVKLGPDGRPVAAGRRQTLLELFQTRQLQGGAASPGAVVEDEEDPLDRPSPLPGHLSMVR